MKNTTKERSKSFEWTNPDKSVTTVLGDRETLTIGKNVTIGNMVHLGRGLTLANHVKIDDHASIGSGATLFKSVKVKRDAIIGHGSVVDEKTIIRAQAIIGHSVRIGCSVDVCNMARVKDYAVLGSYSRIGHGTVIGKRVRISDRVFIGDTAQIKKDAKIGNYTSIGDSAVIGKGAMVWKNLLILAGGKIADGDVVDKVVSLSVLFGTEYWPVTITRTHMAIGSILFPIESWKKFSTAKIRRENPAFVAEYWEKHREAFFGMARDLANESMYTVRFV